MRDLQADRSRLLEQNSAESVNNDPKDGQATASTGRGHLLTCRVYLTGIEPETNSAAFSLYIKPQPLYRRDCRQAPEGFQPANEATPSSMTRLKVPITQMRCGTGTPATANCNPPPHIMKPPITAVPYPAKLIGLKSSGSCELTPRSLAHAAQLE